MNSLPIGGSDASPRDTTVASVWRQLDRLALRAGVWLAPLAVASHVVGYLATGRPAWLVMLLLAVLIGADSAWRLVRRRYDASVLLLLAGASVAVAASLVPPVVRGATTAGLVMLAVAGMLVLPTRTRTPVVAVMGGLLLAQLAWPAVGLAETSEAVSVTVFGLFTMAAGLIAVGTARKTLEGSERTRIEIFRRVPVGLFRASSSGRIIDANPALESMLGYGVTELLGRSIEDLHAFVGEWRGFTSVLEAEDRPQRFAHRWVRADGSAIWVRGTAQTIRAENGEVLYYESAVEDVTQRREAEAVAQMNAARFKTLFERAPIALWEEDFTVVARRLEELRDAGVRDLRAHLASEPEEARNLISLVEFLDVNPAGIHLIGASSREDALARVVPVDPPPHLVESFIDQFVAVWESRDHLSLEIGGVTVDDQPLDLSLHWAATRTATGDLDVTRVIVGITDIGVVRRAERELAALMVSKDELVASVSHELRTPITTIYGMAFELRDNSADFSADETRELIEIIAEQSRELSNIVEDLLVASRSDLNTLAVRPEVVDMRSEIAQIVASSAPESASAVDVPEGIFALADPLRLRQIVRNLLTNARRYGGETVTIHAGTDKRIVYIRVIDNGPGIAEHEREAIFQPYVRAASDRALPGSIGLGLPVSRRLARLMGGDLVYRYDDCSVFEISLPAATRRAVAV